MPNGNSPSGFSPVRDVYSTPYNGAVNVYSTAAGDSTAIFIGDPVKLTGSSQTINGQVTPDVAQAATGDVIVGVVVGVLPAVQSDSIYRVASTQRTLLVCDDPNALFEIQEVNSGTPLTANDIGLNVNFVVAAGSTFTGMSGVTLNNASEATTNTLDCKIVAFVNRADNEIGAAAKWLVRLNRHQYVNQIAGV